MHLSISLSILALAATAFSQAANTSQFNTTQEFYLSIRGKGNCAYDGLYLTAYHTGAGTSDPVFTNDTSVARPFFIAPTNLTGYGPLYYETGNDFPWTMLMGVENFYAAWQSPSMQAVQNVSTAGLANGAAAFFTNATGLQYTTSPGVEGFDAFSGWLVCNWFHNVPQLFWRYYTYDYPTLDICADVDLVMEYI